VCLLVGKQNDKAFISIFDSALTDYHILSLISI